MSEEIYVELGCMAPSLVAQLRPYGISEDRCRVLQKRNEAITTLSLADILTQTQAEKCREKLFKQIEKDLEKVGALI